MNAASNPTSAVLASDEQCQVEGLNGRLPQDALMPISSCLSRTLGARLMSGGSTIMRQVPTLHCSGQHQRNSPVKQENLLSGRTKELGMFETVDTKVPRWQPIPASSGILLSSLAQAQAQMQNISLRKWGQAPENSEDKLGQIHRARIASAEVMPVLARRNHAELG